MASVNVTVIGAGYVGLTTAALLAASGTNVNLLDVSEPKIQTIRNGRSPFFEPGLNELISTVIESGRLNPATDYQQAVPGVKYIFCCVGTPDRADGSSNLDYVFGALESAAKLADDGVVFIQKSTVPVGTGKRLIDALKKSAPNLEFDYVSNPEFLREGSAIKDSLYPDRTVLGGGNKTILGDVADLYKSLYAFAPNIQKTDDQPVSCDFIFTSLESAELIKVTANAFLALKISFANSIAKLSDRVGADINEVMDGVGKDNRIGRAFLNAGRGYGGGCFPKDVSGLLATAAENNTQLEIMDAAVQVNDSMAPYIIDKIEASHQLITGSRVAVLGLAFKANTSDTRRSPAIKLAKLLAQKGAHVSAYDPQAILEEGQALPKGVVRKDSLQAVIKDADMVIVATDWPEFLDIDWHTAKQAMSGRLVVDCMNALDKTAITNVGLSYMGIGR